MFIDPKQDTEPLKGLEWHLANPIPIELLAYVRLPLKPAP